MKTLGACFVLLAAVTLVAADPVTPGTLVPLKEGDTEVNAKPGDIVVARIPNPALAKRVSDLDVKTSGGLKFIGAANAEEIIDGKPAPGGTHINVYASVEKGGAKSGTLEYSYKDGAGKEFKKKVTVQIKGD